MQEGGDISCAMEGMMYRLVCSLLSSQNRSNNSTDEIVDVLKLQFELKIVIVSRRFQFNRRLQATDKTMAEFIAELR